MDEQGCLFWMFVLLLDYLVVSLGVWVIILILNALGATITFTWGLAFGIWIILKILKFIFQRRLSVKGERNLALFYILGVDKMFLLWYNSSARGRRRRAVSPLTTLYGKFCQLFDFHISFRPDPEITTIWPSPMYVLISPSRSARRDPRLYAPAACLFYFPTQAKSAAKNSAVLLVSNIFSQNSYPE